MKNNHHEKDYHKSTDLVLAAVCSYFGYFIEAIDRTNPNKVEFIIKRDEKLDDLLKAFWLHQLEVEPLAFFNCVKELKTRIYSE
jgi:hypothetical protein